MEQPPDGAPLQPNDVIAARMKELRAERGWSADHLAKEMAKVGIPWDRSVVAKFENRHRRQLDVPELLALAYVLGVSPIHLLVPSGPALDEAPYAVTPNAPAGGEHVLGVRYWLRGLEPVPRQHPTWFYEEKERHGHR